VPALVAAKTASTGQSCGSPSRVLVHRSRHDEVVDRFVAAAADVVMGPLNNAARRAAVHQLVVDARDLGATVRCGGELPTTPGFHYPVTVLADVPPTARVLAEEPFGPVLAVLSYVDEADAVRIANDNDFALSAYVFGEPAHAERIAEQVNAGSVTVNGVPTAFPDAPLGGRQASGYGYEGGAAGLLAFGRFKILQTQGRQA
jgi:succinate-semialdehyde dehydrogenase/glutarate-semialdehyde dehydrogenase